RSTCKEVNSVNQSNGTRSRKHDLTVTPHFIGHGEDQTIVGVNVKTAVRAHEQNGWRRGKGKGGMSRYVLAGQSRCVIRFRNPQSRRYSSLVFALGKLRPAKAVAA